MIDWKWPLCFAKNAPDLCNSEYPVTKYSVVTVFGEAEGSTFVDNGRMSRPVVSRSAKLRM